MPARTGAWGRGLNSFCYRLCSSNQSLCHDRLPTSYPGVVRTERGKMAVEVLFLGIIVLKESHRAWTKAALCL